MEGEGNTAKISPKIPSSQNDLTYSLKIFAFSENRKVFEIKETVYSQNYLKISIWLFGKELSNIMSILFWCLTINF